MDLLQGNHHQIAPVSQPIAICGQFVLNQPQTLVLKEKVLSIGDSFDVNLDNGWPLLKVRGSLLSISGRKRVEDSQGTHLFDIVKEHLHLHTTYALKDPNQQKICEVKSKISFIGSKASATFTDRHGRMVTLNMQGNWSDRRAQIIEEQSGQTAAYIDRKRFSGREIMFGQDTYSVVVAPGVDAALIAALCICFDEKKDDE